MKPNLLVIKHPNGDEEVVGCRVTCSGWHGLEWSHDGTCRETSSEHPEPARRPDLDWGTPGGDLLIDPWMQDALKQKAGK